MEALILADLDVKAGLPQLCDAPKWCICLRGDQEQVQWVGPPPESYRHPHPGRLVRAQTGALLASSSPHPILRRTLWEGRISVSVLAKRRNMGITYSRHKGPWRGEKALKLSLLISPPNGMASGPCNHIKERRELFPSTLNTDALVTSPWAPRKILNSAGIWHYVVIFYVKQLMYIMPDVKSIIPLLL
jgi:hypothetical protein